MHFNRRMVSLDKAMVFKDPPCERSLVKAKIVHTLMLCIKAWSCETKNGLEMHSYGGGHWSRYWFASHKQGHCLEMYPYAFPMGFNLGLVPLDQAFVFNWSIWERSLFKAQIVYAPFIAIGEWLYVPRNRLHMHEPRQGHCWKHWLASYDHAFQ